MIFFLSRSARLPPAPFSSLHDNAPLPTSPIVLSNRPTLRFQAPFCQIPRSFLNFYRFEILFCYAWRKIALRLSHNKTMPRFFQSWKIYIYNYINRDNFVNIKFSSKFFKLSRRKVPFRLEGVIQRTNYNYRIKIEGLSSPLLSSPIRKRTKQLGRSYHRWSTKKKRKSLDSIE